MTLITVWILILSEGEFTMKEKMGGISSLYRNQTLKNINLIQVTVTSTESLHCKFPQGGFLFPIKGRAQLTIDEETTTYLTSSYVQHIKSGSYLHLFSLDQIDFEFILLSYTFGNSTLSPDECIPNSFHLKLTEAKKTHMMLKRLMGKITSSHHYHTLTLELEMRKLLNTALKQGDTSEHQLLDVVCSYIKKHLSTPITLDELAAYFDKKPAQLSHLFYKNLGIRPIEYLIRQRLEKATELLKQGYSVQLAASKVGYDDALYFSRLYKKYYHIRPSEVKDYHRVVC